MASISNNEIARAIYLVSKGKTESEMRNISSGVARFLQKKRLFKKSADILRKLDEIADRGNGKISVKVLGVKKMDERFKKELSVFLKKRYGAQELLLEETEDRRLLGGIRMEVDGEVIDLSVKNKIKKLQEYLMAKI